MNPSLPPFPSPVLRSRLRGAALIIVLAFIVMVTGLVVAFFSRAINERQIANSSANQTQTELFAQGALSQILGALKQEIAANSTATAVTGGTLYAPTSPAYAVPTLVGSTGAGGLENLLKISASGTGFYPGASFVLSSSASTTGTSLNGRSISTTRWNKPLLLGKATPTSTSVAPVASFTAPSWVLVTRDGSNPTTWNSNLAWSQTNATTAVGRYAYAIYDEGGLLDMNVAGYPSAAASTTIGSTELARKGALAFADLTQLPALAGTDANTILTWRNAATGDSNYTAAVRSNTTGFLIVSGTGSGSGIVTDRAFPSRQALMKFITSGTLGLSAANAQNLLQYMGTFSRDLNQPSFDPTDRPAVTAGRWGNTGNTEGGNNYYGKDHPSNNATNPVNPVFLKVRVSGTFTRMNGSQAQVGEPLVKTRFPLDRLNLITRTATATTSSDIYKYFGLTRASVSDPWIYDHPEVTSYPSTGYPNTSDDAGHRFILNLDDVAAQNREPDFFELLKAAIMAGSLGKGSGWPNTTGYSAVLNGQQVKDTRLDYQIIQIGANIIDQWDTDDFPTQISFDGESFAGIENLPYLLTAHAFILQTGSSTGNCLFIPTVWNPHDPAQGPASDTPAQLRVWGEVTSGTRTLTLGSFSRAVTGGTAVWTGTSVPFPTCDANNTAMTFSLNETNRFHIPIRLMEAGNSYNLSPVTSNSNCVASNFWLSGSSGGTRTIYGVAGVAITLPASTTVVSGSTYTLQFSDIQKAPYYCVFKGSNPGITIHLEVNDSGTWKEYDRKQMPQTDVTNQPGLRYANSGFWFSNPDISNSSYPLCFIDPRTARGSIGWMTNGEGACTVGGGTNTFYPISTAAPANLSASPFVVDNYLQVFGGNRPTVTGQHGWRSTAGLGVDSNLYRGSLSVNKIDSATTSTYVNDPDGITRRAMAYYARDFSDWPQFDTAISGTSTNLASVGLGHSRRPIILNRPFRSVAELGHVFRGSWWRNLDFTFPESGDSALLDVFCISDPNPGNPLVAGKLNLNTRQKPCLAAVIAGAYYDELNQTGARTTLAPLNGTAALAVANALVNRTASTSGTMGPLRNLAELVGRPVSGATGNNPTTRYTGFSGDLDPVLTDSNGNVIVSQIPRMREAAVRALADCGTTRVWNLMIDVIAQSGRYPQSATGLDNFLVEGEKRYWLHVAIDRATGEILDQQMEPVTE